MPTPVLLLHSSLASGAQWRTLAASLEARYQVFAPDLIGYGKAPAWGGEGPFHLHDEARAIHALLDGLDEPAHLVGHSYGGAVALHVAREHGPRLSSLTLIEPVAFHLLRDGDAADAAALAEIRAVADGIARGLASGEYASACGAFVDYWSGAGTWASMGQAKRAAAALRVGKVALDFHATLEQRARLAGLERLPLPTLVVHGERSPAPTRRICERLASRLPDVRAETIPGAGHMSPITHAEEVNALITAHLDANSQHRIGASHPHHPRRESWIPQS